MKTKILLIVSFLFSTMSLSAQNKAYQPNVQIQVNVQKDENGNIIRYDSTYIETWSSDGAEPVNIDSLLEAMGFVMPFGNDYFPGMSFSPFQDSLSMGFGTPLMMPQTPEDIEQIERMMQEHIRQMQQMMMSPFDVPEQQQSNVTPKIQYDFDDTSI